MKKILDGIASALITAFFVTFWSIAISYDSSVAGTTFLDLLLFSLASFGMIALPSLLYGCALGLFLYVWGVELHALESRDDDRHTSGRIASASLSIPLVAAATAVFHLLVSSQFVRPVNQAGALLLASIAIGFSLFAIEPLIRSALLWILSKVGLAPDANLWATRRLFLLLGILLIIGFLAGIFFATTLNFWSLHLIFMVATIALAVPALIAALHFRPFSYGPKSFAALIAATAITILLFAFSAPITSRSAATRAWTTSNPSIIAFQSRILQRITDSDHDGFSPYWGGADCNDSDPSIYPGAPDIPGDGIDQSCSGADATPVVIDPAITARLRLENARQSALAASKREAEKIPDPPKNILVILVDTLRMDHTGFGGYPRNTTPNLDALAAKSTVFMNAYATSPHTPRSIPAIFISRYPSHTKWKGAQYNYPKVLPANLSFFEVLHDAGWQTQGVSSHHYFQEKRGLNQGFDNWDNSDFKSIAESNDDIAAPRTWAKFSPILDRYAAEKDDPKHKPFAVFLHFFEPHARWIPHTDYHFDNDGSTESKHIASYDSEVRFSDEYVGKVLHKLKETGLDKSTIVVIVADHGEGFNEHGFFFHGQTLYNEALHVPIIIHVPGWPAKKIDTPVSIIDIAPTLIDLQKISVPKDFEGISLVSTMLNGDPEGSPQRPIFAELLPYTAWKEHHKAVILGNLKLINVLSSGTQELYDLEIDPKEKKNRVGETSLAKPLQDALNQFMTAP